MESARFTVSGVIMMMMSVAIMVFAVGTGGCAVPMDHGEVGDVAEALRTGGSHDSFAINPFDPTADDAESVILHMFQGCLSACLDELNRLNRICDGRDLSDGGRERCRRIALREYQSCASACPQEEFPTP